MKNACMHKQVMTKFPPEYSDSFCFDLKPCDHLQDRLKWTKAHMEYRETSIRSQIGCYRSPFDVFLFMDFWTFLFCCMSMFVNNTCSTYVVEKRYEGKLVFEVQIYDSPCSSFSRLPKKKCMQSIMYACLPRSLKCVALGCSTDIRRHAI